MVKRKLKVDATYVIQEILREDRQNYVGYKCRVLLQVSDDGLPPYFLAAEVLMLGGPFSGRRLLLQGIRLRRYQNERPTCRCKAYSFPHHKGTGRCYASSFPPFCGECGKPCDARYNREEKEDFRPNKIYSTTGFYLTSSCCEATCFDDPELTIPYSED